MNRLLAIVLLCGTGACGVAEKPVFPAPSSWSLRGQAQSFSPENLYKIIDGEADLFLRYGFKQAVFQDYVNAADLLVNTELYEMASPLDAFGIYSVSRTTKGKDMDLGNGGTLGSTQLTFYQGPYFARVTASKLEGAPEALTTLGQALAKGIPAAGEKPPELKYLDLPEVDPNTVQFIAQNALDIPGLDQCLTANARASQMVRVFVALARKPAETGTALQAIERYGQGKGTGWNRTSGVDQVNLPKLNWVIFSSKGRIVAGVADMQDPKMGLALLDKILSKIPQ